MTCQQCGAIIPDGCAVCPGCGSALRPALARRLSKKEYLRTAAPTNTRISAGLIWITVLISVVLIFFGVHTLMHQDILQIPAVEMGLDLLDPRYPQVSEAVDDTFGRASDYYDTASRSLERNGYSLSRKDEKALENALEQLDEFLDTPSIANGSRLISYMDENQRDIVRIVEALFNEDDPEYRSAMDFYDQVMDPAPPILPWVILGVWALFFLPLLFTLLSGIRKGGFLTVLALLFTLPLQFLLAGVIPAVLSAIVYVVQLVLCVKVSAAFRRHRRGHTL